MPFVKRNETAQGRFFASEATGVRWMAAADGVPCVGAIATGEARLTLERLESVGSGP